ncbi:MAG: FtsH protease activity modulator HflK [Burkholderiales bacterium]
MNELHAFPSRNFQARIPCGPLKKVAQAARDFLFEALRCTLGRRMSTIILNGNRRGDGPPDLDELWHDFNRKLAGLFGRGSGSSRPPEPDFRQDVKGAGLGLGLVVGVVALVWASTGVFIVQEGEQGVVMSFGKYSKTVEAGFQLRLPYPFQSHEIVSVTRLRSVEVGRSAVAVSTGLRDSSMLTKDENIVDIRFTVQYRIKSITGYLFENLSPDDAVTQASESAVREIVGRSQMDSVLYERRDAIQEDLVKSVQAQLDRLKTGILVVSVNVQSVQAPDQVQAAFDDAFKAGADSERLKNEGQAYANDLIPRARGDAARLLEEAKGYKASVIDRAKGDSERFVSLLDEYQKAPVVMRDRLYIDAMQQIYSSVSKVMVDGKGHSNLLYLPLDKLMQQGQAGPPMLSSPSSNPAASLETPSRSNGSSDPRSRDNQRSRERDSR